MSFISDSFVRLLLLLLLQLQFSLRVTLPWWGTADAEMKVPPGWVQCHPTFPLSISKPGVGQNIALRAATADTSAFPIHSF